MFLLSLFLLILVLPFIIADEESQVESAYACLENKIETQQCSSLSFEQKVFSLMSVYECRTEVMNSVSSNNCWPDPNCDIKSTAQAIFALDGVNENTSLAEKWLLSASQNAIPTELEWFLEIETSGPTTCTVSYSDENYQISIDSDRKISSTNTGSCLTLAQDDYWLQISPNCYNMEIHTSCESNTFLTTTLFKRQDSSTIHISKEVHKTSKGGLTEEVVSSLCFGEGNTCDYEGSLWSTLVLHSKGHDISEYMPYLITMVSDNEKFLPESFLYFLTGRYRTELLLGQKLNKYWDESGDKYYDTALAAWPFYWEKPMEWRNARDWLLDIQGADGCWDSGNLKNTAFILRSFWPRSPPECEFDRDCSSDDEVCTDKQCIVPPPVCGDNIIEGSENCDGTNLGDTTCADFGSNYVGDLFCYPSGDSSECSFNSTGCGLPPECTLDENCTVPEICISGQCAIKDSVCGDGIIEGIEQCDGTNLSNMGCSDIDSDLVGDLFCFPSEDYDECFFNSTGCGVQRCVNNSDCTAPKTCNTYGFCKVPKKGGNVPCDSSFDCLSSQECFEGICVDNEFLDCEDSGYFCMIEANCEASILPDYSASCYSSFKCCSEEKPLETCSAQGGEICSSDEICEDGVTAEALYVATYETCCIGGGTCEEEEPIEEAECFENDGTCRTDCDNNEEESLSFVCEDYGDICCVEKTKPEKSIWFIWVLVVLVVLATLGIVFRDKIGPMWLKLKSKFGKKKPRRRPGMPITPGRMPIRRRPLLKGMFKKQPPRHTGIQRPAPQGRRPVQLRRPGEKPKPHKGELDDVLKKLREMGK